MSDTCNGYLLTLAGMILMLGGVVTMVALERATLGLTLILSAAVTLAAASHFFSHSFTGRSEPRP